MLPDGFYWVRLSGRRDLTVAQSRDGSFIFLGNDREFSKIDGQVIGMVDAPKLTAGGAGSQALSDERLMEVWGESLASVAGNVITGPVPALEAAQAVAIFGRRIEGILTGET